jgi:hypothetical protein
MHWLGWRRRQHVRINEQVHWSVGERLGWPRALVDKGPPCRYAPPNLKHGVKSFTEPLVLEAALADHSTRRWSGKCPMERANPNLVCQCKVRDLEAMKRRTGAAAGTSPPIAA